MTTVFLSEDHHLVREGIKMLLQRDPTLALIGESGCGEETVQQVQKLKPDILLLDLMLPGLHGLEVLRQVGK
jgi:DNA-binding NarL/FixJ family response regulator